MTWPRAAVVALATAVFTLALLSAGCDQEITGHPSLATAATPAPSGSRPTQRSVIPVPDARQRDQIRVLDAALQRIEARVRSGDPSLGDLDLRDVAAYHVDALWRQGIDGYGTTVAVMEGWDDPSIQAHLDRLDDEIGLPHARVETIHPDGPRPARCPAGMVKLGSYGSCDAWKGELDLDVEAAHLMAPYATILVVATPADSEVVGDASSEVAMPEMIEGVEYVSTHRLANVISISDGSSETDYSRGAAEIHAQDLGEVTAAAHGIPVMNATGDCGATQNLTTATSQCGTVSSGPAVATWADSPWVTAVGGSSPAYPDRGDAAARAFPLDPIEGAGLSEMYARPAYQDGIARISGSRQRSVPDITMDSADGTSESAPLMAGVLALATQVKGSNLGPINELLYDRLAADPAADGLVDVTSGNDHFGSVPGWSAGKGYDVASGWGTVDASRFVPALARAARSNPMTSAAVRALQPFQDTLELAPSDRLTAGGMLVVTSRGFLPGHPVTLRVGGRRLRTVTADTSGNISYAFRPETAGLHRGKHRLTIHSMLLDQAASFAVS